jgi:hypothetical protein
MYDRVPALDQTVVHPFDVVHLDRRHGANRCPRPGVTSGPATGDAAHAAPDLVVGELLGDVTEDPQVPERIPQAALAAPMRSILDRHDHHRAVLHHPFADCRSIVHRERPIAMRIAATTGVRSPRR